jgi:protease II
MHPKLLQALLILIVLFNCHTLRSQSRTIVRLTDNNDAPISGAFWRVDSTRFGVSDKSGAISLARTDPNGGDVKLSVSHISFRDTVVQVNPSTGNDLQVVLELDNVALPEINVIGGKSRKFRSPEHLLRMALKAKKKNYPDEVTQRTALYREILTYEDCPVNLNEGLLEMEISPYTDKFRRRKSWSETWDRYWSSYVVYSKGKYKYLDVGSPEGTQQYAAVNDRYRVLNSRISSSGEPHNFRATLRDGSLQMLSLDKVRLGYDYLSPKLLKEYRFTLKDSVFVNDAYCYRLAFEPANNKPAKYIGTNKQQPVGAFKGEIYLDLKSLAIVRFKGVNTKAIRRNATKGRHYVPVGTMTTEVNYARTGNGKWQLAEVINSNSPTAGSSYKVIRTLYLTDEDLESGAKNASRWRYQNHMWTLRNLTRSYDEKYWTVFEQSSFYQRAKLVNFDCPASSQPGAEEFRAPFLRDSVYTPSARPMRDISYVKEKRIRNAWVWLEDPTDSATTSYLKWENDYYEQYFYHRQNELEDVSAEFSRRAQGMPPIAEPTAKNDTLLRTFDGQTGAYRIVPDGDTTLLVAIGPRKPDYVFTDFGWSNKAKYYYTLQESRDYDRLLSVYPINGEKAERSRIDDHLWRKDTLYVTGSNDLLRTAKFSRWTAAGRWEDLLQEEDPTFEFRMQTTPAGELILISESMTTAYVFAQSKTGWRKEPVPYPALSGGSGMRGRGCKAELAVDYVADCRETDLGTCVLAVKSARHELWMKPAGEAQWKRISLPEGQHHATFGPVKNGQIVVETEGVSAYGQEYTVDFSNQRLQPRKTDYPVINLPGYRDSIVWVKAPDGVAIPCQLRWKADLRTSLKNTLLKVYAAYGTPALTGHRQEDIALMNLGVAIVYVYARGGGTRGPEWYEAGRGANKIVGCKDYLAAAKYFHRRNPLGKTSLSGYAQSAGGPVLGYAVNEAPELFSAAVFDYTYLDVSGTMSRPELPLTVYEYLEWGNPADKKIREAQASYSPYQNVREQVYPAMLFLSGRYDKSTPYWQVAKTVAALRKANKGDAPILLRTAMRGSHPGTPFGPGQNVRVERMAFLVVNAGFH